MAAYARIEISKQQVLAPPEFVNHIRIIPHVQYSKHELVFRHTCVKTWYQSIPKQLTVKERKDSQANKYVFD